MPFKKDNTQDFFIVVDVEAAGPTPGEFAMLSVGACTVSLPHQTFYIELKPDSLRSQEEAMRIHGLSMHTLAQQGVEPRAGMHAFARWVKEVTPQGKKAVFTAFNAPFDWMFVNEYFHRYLEHNPFGHKALDIKAYFMGLHGVSWAETSHKEICAYYGLQAGLSHNAVEDAQQEASLFALILDEMERQDSIKEN